MAETESLLREKAPLRIEVAQRAGIGKKPGGLLWPPIQHSSFSTFVSSSFLVHALSFTYSSVGKEVSVLATWFLSHAGLDSSPFLYYLPQSALLHSGVSYIQPCNQGFP